MELAAHRSTVERDLQAANVLSTKLGRKLLPDVVSSHVVAKPWRILSECRSMVKLSHAEYVQETGP